MKASGCGGQSRKNGKSSQKNKGMRDPNSRGENKRELSETKKDNSPGKKKRKRNKSKKRNRWARQKKVTLSSVPKRTQKKA